MPVHAPIQLRCKGKLQGTIKEYPDGKKFLEVRCKDGWCTERTAGVVVLHYFSLEDGSLDHTKKYRDPVRKPQSGRLGPNGKEHGNNDLSKGVS